MVEEQPKEGEQRFWDQKVYFLKHEMSILIYLKSRELNQRAEENNSVKRFSLEKDESSLQITLNGALRA